MSLRHIPYDKIAESTNDWNLKVDVWKKLKKVNWIVTEKIHGANFCVLTNGAKFEFAKRKQILSENENFFGCQRLKETLRLKVGNIFQVLKNSHEGVRQISVYGELFGGSYPHPNIPTLPDVFPVQTGVYYCPDVNFMAFDIILLFDDARTEWKFLDFNEFENVCRTSDLFYSRLLFKGSYEECLNFNNRFPTTIPDLLNLPKLEGVENYAEGIVMKMEKTYDKESLRLAIKRKIVEFDETEEYHGAEKWPTSHDKERQLLLPFATENRMRNVLSKVGLVQDLRQDTLSQVVSDFADDVLDAYYTSSFSETSSTGGVDVIDSVIARDILEIRGNDIIQKLVLES